MSFSMLRLFLLGWVFCVVAPMSTAHALKGFEGLDFGSKAKKKAKKSKRNSANHSSDTSSPDEEETRPEKSAPESSNDATKGPANTNSTEKKASASGMSFDALDVSGKTGDRQKLDAIVSLFKDEQYEQSALAAYEIIQDPKLAAISVEARYSLAKSLYRMGLYHSALGEFSKILALGQNNRLFKSSLEWLFFISRKTVNEQVVLDEIAKYANAEFPARFQNEFRYLLARYHFVRGQALEQVGQLAEANQGYEEVKRLSLMIPRGDAFYARAKYLEGLTLFRESKLPQALEAMKNVVRETRISTGPETSEIKARKALRELAFMQLARTHYGAKQNRYALYYFNKVERGGTQWLESLFEAAWASYRIGQYEQALGNLITLSSPFFRDEYFPEALILKAVIYYENCRYSEALAIIEDFQNLYAPVQQELQQLVQRNLDTTEYYNLLADVQKRHASGQVSSDTDVILGRILNLALTDKDLKKTNDSILELEAEIDSFGGKNDAFKYSNLSKQLMEDLRIQREGLTKKAGIMSKGKLEFELEQLKQFLANGLRIKFETTSKEKEFLEEQLKAGGKTAVVKRYKYSVAVSDDQLYWPYAGEFWRDELGTYQYTLTKGCVELKSLVTQSEGQN